MVNVPPSRRSRGRPVVRAAAAISAISVDRAAKLFPSASGTTGTMSPRSVSTATPMLTYRL